MACCISNTTGTPEMTHDPEKVTSPRLCCSYRLLVTLVAMLSLTLSFGTQATMSSALVCMTDTDADHYSIMAQNSSLSTVKNNNLTHEHHANSWKFSWSYSEKGWILASYFIGVYTMQLTTGTILLPRFGIKKTVIASMALTGCMQLLTVPAAVMGLPWMYTNRFLAGIATGPLYPSTIGLMANWAPPLERSFLFGLTGIGNELGSVFSFSIGAASCQSDVQGGWPFVFYTMGTLAFLLVVLNFVFITDWPSSNSLLGIEEKSYLVRSSPGKNAESDKMGIPYRKIMTSLPVWAILIGRFGTEFFFFMAVTQTPIYFADVLHLSQYEVSIASGFPFLFVIPTVYVAGLVSDKLVVKGVLSIGGVRKLNDAIAKVSTSVLFIILGFLPEKSVVSAFMVNTLAASSMGLTYLSYVANPADICPRYTGFITGLSTTFCSWVSFAIPILVVAMTPETKFNASLKEEIESVFKYELLPAFMVNTLTASAIVLGYLSYVANPADISLRYAGFITSTNMTGGGCKERFAPFSKIEPKRNKSREQWQKTFYLGVGIQIVVTAFYCTFASGELQPWARTEDDFTGPVARQEVLVAGKKSFQPKLQTESEKIIHKEYPDKQNSNKFNEKTPLIPN